MQNEFESLMNKIMKQTNKKGVEEESIRMKPRMKKIGIRNLILRAKALIPK